MKPHELKLYNTYTRRKEVFEPLVAGRIGLYVCGPTVYNDVHLGNCRTFINFDIIYRYLVHLGYKVRYVRNITDAGHLEGDFDEGEDKFAKRAQLEQLEPMEIVQKYTVGFRDIMRIFNTLPPSIEPTATGHITEQIEVVARILKNGFAYEKEGSIYFDTIKFAKAHPEYGQLSGKKLDDLLTETRELKNQDEKHNPADFALWIKAKPQTLQRWPSPWGSGFPGWHLECSAMSTKYLGDTFDIHGGGMDLQFPHHENEIAQNIGCCGVQPARYWLHANMLTVNGVRMSKSKGNGILPLELFTGENAVLSKGYSPMTVRFFMLQTHYTSTLDFSDDALQAGEKGYKRLLEAVKLLQKMDYTGSPALTDDDAQVNAALDAMYEFMNDDFNTPQALARSFELVTKIYTIANKQLSINALSAETFARLKTTLPEFVFDIFGLSDETANAGGNSTALAGVMELVLDLRTSARTNKDWATSDQIRDALKNAGVQVKDGKEGTTWGVE
jgi:cysteinyl-tRNA synthetase